MIKLLSTILTCPRVGSIRTQSMMHIMGYWENFAITFAFVQVSCLIVGLIESARNTATVYIQDVGITGDIGSRREVKICCQTIQMCKGNAAPTAQQVTFRPV